MNTMRLLILAISSLSLIPAQTVAPQPGMPADQMIHQSRPGMQHGGAHMDGIQMMQEPEHPDRKTGTETPPPDLLKEVPTRSAMRLEQFQQFALGSNPTLQQANALARQSGAQARQAGLYPNPSVGYQGEQVRGGAYGGGEQGGFIQQSLVLGGKLGLRRNVYEQQRRSDEIGVSEQRYRVLSDIGQSFYSALGAQQVVALRKRLLSLASDALQTAHQLANVGQADAPDILQAEVEAEGAKLDYTTAQLTYIQIFRSLTALAGRPELDVSPLAGDLEHPPQIDADRLLSQIVQESPTVKRAQQDIARAQAELQSARRESIPDILVHAGVQQNNELLGGAGNTRTGVQAFATASVTLPVFNRNQGNVAAANAEVERTQAEVRRLQLALRESTQPLVQQYRSSQAQADRYRNEMIPRAARAYQLYLDKYQNMAAAYPQVLISQRTLFQLQVAYINVLENLWMNTIALQNYALSSGLSAPVASGSMSTTLNLPTSSGAGQ